MNTLSLPDSNQLYVVMGRPAATQRLLDLAARLALRGPLLILDCGNRANPLPLVRELRRLTPDPVRAMGNLHMARAFTCYQVRALLLEAAGWTIPRPVVIFDLLATFYDENVTHPEAARLLEQSLRCITAMRRFSPLVISLQPPPPAFPEREAFAERVCHLADALWTEAAPQAAQPRQAAFAF